MGWSCAVAMYIAVGLIALSHAACSNEIDRRDELGIDREGRSDLPSKAIWRASRIQATAAVEADNRTILVGKKLSRRKKCRPSLPNTLRSTERGPKMRSLFTTTLRGFYGPGPATWTRKAQAQFKTQSIWVSGL